MRDVNKYTVVNNLLRWDLWERKNRVPPPFSRPVIDSGEAFKKVYLSKAPAHFDHEQLTKALNNHVGRMKAELAASGKMVTSITKTLDGQEGDMRIIMKWVVLGQKRNKHFRRLHAKLQRQDASGLAPVEGSTSESGHPDPQKNLQAGSL